MLESISNIESFINFYEILSTILLEISIILSNFWSKSGTDKTKALFIFAAFNK